MLDCDLAKINAIISDLKVPRLRKSGSHVVYGQIYQRYKHIDNYIFKIVQDIFPANQVHIVDALQLRFDTFDKALILNIGSKDVWICEQKISLKPLEYCFSESFSVAGQCQLLIYRFKI